MAPSRGKGKARATAASTGRATALRPSTRATRTSQNEGGDIYDDMLAEASRAESVERLSDRPLKRRRVVAESTPDRAAASGRATSDRPSGGGKRLLQTVEDSSASEEDEHESEFDFEDVDLVQDASPADNAQVDDDDDENIADVSVAIESAKAPQSTRAKRKPASAEEKAFRLLVHKAHVLCLLGHCLHINSWCSNEVVHKHLRPLLLEKIITFLNPRPKDSQFRQNEAFMDGIQQAADVFRGEFRVNASGMRSSQWTSDPDEVTTVPMDRADFITAARNLEGSQDTGNQLFCALLRAVGVEARMVCSLQPLPFVNALAKFNTPQKTAKPTVFATIYGVSSPASGSNTEDSAVNASSTIGKVPSARRRLGQPAFSSDPVPTNFSLHTKKKVQRLHYPVFWAEAFNPAHQKWIAVDPLVTQAVNKPSKLEPPASYSPNQLSYAIAFESSAVAKDVTRRYTRSFNAKTRRSRVETTENGAAWLKKVLRFFRRTGGALDRDQVEDAELAQREAREGLPSNVLDFKDHPYYALERHMRRHEVIFPKREVGRVNTGTAAKPRMEAVFRRRDVCDCRSADKWYRLGRTVKQGEVAVKRVPTRRTRQLRSPSPDAEEGQDAMLTPLYTASQTELYIPPSITAAGKVPRNAFGNLDIYVPSMVPAGGAHIRHPLARPAALTLKIDAVDAVVGFQFKGRQGTAIVDGVVVAEGNAEAVRAMIGGLEEEKVEEGGRARSRVALGFWRRFLVGLRIRERVAGYGEMGREEEEQQEKEKYVEGDGDGEGGGFLEGDAEDEDALPTAGKYYLAELMTAAKAGKRKIKNPKDDSEEEEEEPDFEGDETDEEITEAQPSPSRRTSRRVIRDDSEDEYMPDHRSAGPTVDANGEIAGGGFFADDDAVGNGKGGDGGAFVADNDGEGGGFMPEVGEDDGGGGGFLPDADQDMEEARNDGDGGFIPDDAEMQDDEGGSAAAPNTSTHGLANSVSITPSEAVDNDVIHNFVPMPEHAIEDAHTSGHMRPHPMLMQHDLDNTITQDLATATDEIIGIADATPKTPHTLPAEETPAVEEGEASDRGSMLSHDPDDEDAEPDWLESD